MCVRIVYEKIVFLLLSNHDGEKSRDDRNMKLIERGFVESAQYNNSLSFLRTKLCDV